MYLIQELYSDEVRCNNLTESYEVAKKFIIDLFKQWSRCHIAFDRDEEGNTKWIMDQLKKKSKLFMWEFCRHHYSAYPYSEGVRLINLEKCKVLK